MLRNSVVKNNVLPIAFIASALIGILVLSILQASTLAYASDAPNADITAETPSKTIASTSEKKEVSESPVMRMRAHLQKKKWFSWKEITLNKAVTLGSNKKSLNINAFGEQLLIPGAITTITTKTYSDGTSETSSVAKQINGSFKCRVYLNGSKWQSAKKATTSSKTISGSTKKNKRIEGVKFSLTGELAQYFDIYYRSYIMDAGWLGWAKNGVSSGAPGKSLSINRVQVKLVLKGTKAPGKTSMPVYSGITNNPTVDKWLKAKAKKLKTLRACYVWTMNHRHTDWAGFGTTRYKNGTEYWYASEVARMKDGLGTDCYSFSATFACLARALGYNAKVICGYVPSRSAGWAAHSWVEVKKKGGTYCYDPDLGRSYRGVNFYAFRYGSSPTNYKKQS